MSEVNQIRKKTAFLGVKNLILVTPSDWLAHIVKQSFLGDYPVEVINNGINTDVFKPTEGRLLNDLGIKNKRLILGVASPWSERKGLRDFIKLSEKVPVLKIMWQNPYVENKIPVEGAVNVKSNSVYFTQI